MTTTKIRPSNGSVKGQSHGMSLTRTDHVVDPTSPEFLTPDTRLEEVATILAKGILRMRDQRRAEGSPISPTRIRRISTGIRPAPGRDAGFSPESGQNDLEVFGQTSPDGQCG